jgi:hypothetical protein
MYVALLDEKEGMIPYSQNGKLVLFRREKDARHVAGLTGMPKYVNRSDMKRLCSKHSLKMPDGDT